MSFAHVVPHLLETAAADAARIDAGIRAGNLAAAIPTTQVTAAAADEVSAAIAALFSAHAREYQESAAWAATYHVQFVRGLTAAAESYTGTEMAIVTLFRGRWAR